jgi:hypothetical protein
MPGFSFKTMRAAAVWMAVAGAFSCEDKRGIEARTDIDPIATRLEVPTTIHVRWAPFNLGDDRAFGGIGLRDRTTLYVWMSPASSVGPAENAQAVGSIDVPEIVARAILPADVQAKATRVGSMSHLEGELVNLRPKQSTVSVPGAIRVGDAIVAIVNVGR